VDTTAHVNNAIVVVVAAAAASDVDDVSAPSTIIASLMSSAEVDFDGLNKTQLTPSSYPPMISVGQQPLNVAASVVEVQVAKCGAVGLIHPVSSRIRTHLVSSLVGIEATAALNKTQLIVGTLEPIKVFPIRISVGQHPLKVPETDAEVHVAKCGADGLVHTPAGVRKHLVSMSCA